MTDKPTVIDTDQEHRELVKTVEKLLPESPPERQLKLDAALTRLWRQLPELLYRWSPHPTYSDYECVFCGQRPKSQFHDIEHDSDCIGIELSKVML